MKHVSIPNGNFVCLRVSSAQCLLRGAQESSGRKGNLNHVLKIKTRNNKRKKQKPEISEL